MKKITPNLEDSTASTLLITLYMRALDAQSAHPVLGDSKSVELVQRVDYPFEKFDGKNSASLLGVAVRVKYFDKVVSDFIDAHDDAVVVEIGCGVDARYHRVDKLRTTTYYGIDLPEVIEFRKQLLAETDEISLLAQSAFDTQWLDELKARHPESSFLFLIEGVLMYFPEEQVKTLFTNIADRFPGARICFDGMIAMFSNHSKQHDTLSRTDATFKWGFDDNTIFEQWHKALHLEDVFYIMKGMAKVSFSFRLLSLLPRVGKGSKIITLSIAVDA